MKILLIEDDQNLCMAIRNQLTKDGFVVDVCRIKPFHVKELSARVRALLRRPPQITEITSLSFDDLVLNLAGQQLCCNNTSLLLTPKEFNLIQIFLSSPGTIFSREQLMQKAWGASVEVEPGNVDNYIYFLRKRLKTLNSNCYINSVYGSGYILETKHG